MIVFIFQLLIALFLLRFHIDLFRIYRNPVAGKILSITDPIVLPIKKLIIKTPLKKLPADPSALITAWLLAVFAGLVFAHGGIVPALIFGTLILLISTWLNVIIYSIFLTAIASWLQTPPDQPVLQIARACNRPILAPLQRIIPPLGMFDISPVIALFILLWIKNSAIPQLLNALLQSISA